MKMQALGLAIALTVSAMAPAAEDGATITVYKSPNCGCCSDWVKHLEDNDFNVEVHNTNNLNPIKMKAGLTPALASCHTAFIGDYVVEGHVPASDIRRLIEQAPKARGLAVPGMPAGSPGMEMGDHKDNYQVLMFNDEGQTRVFAEYP